MIQCQPLFNEQEMHPEFECTYVCTFEITKKTVTITLQDMVLLGCYGLEPNDDVMSISNWQKIENSDRKENADWP
jgi:hypothetical protein